MEDMSQYLAEAARAWIEKCREVDRLQREVEQLRSTGRTTRHDDFIAGFMAAREYYGTTDSETDVAHGGECDRVRGPYTCTCDEASQLREARDYVKHFYALNGD